MPFNANTQAVTLDTGLAPLNAGQTYMALFTTVGVSNSDNSRASLGTMQSPPGDDAYAQGSFYTSSSTNVSTLSFTATNNDTAFTIVFGPVAAIPEPQIYAMMLVGLGLVGFAAQYRKQKAA